MAKRMTQSHYTKVRDMAATSYLNPRTTARQYARASQRSHPTHVSTVSKAWAATGARIRRSMVTHEGTRRS